MGGSFKGKHEGKGFIRSGAKEEWSLVGASLTGTVSDDLKKSTKRGLYRGVVLSHGFMWKYEGNVSE